MVCNSCKNLVHITDNNFPYFIKNCGSCGRQIKFRKSPNNRLELTIEAGEQFIVPPEYLKIAANPLKGNGHLTKHGMGWFAELIFIEDLNRNADEIDSIVEINDKYCNNYLKNSELLSDLNISNLDDSGKIFEILEKNKASVEW